MLYNIRTRTDSHMDHDRVLVDHEYSQGTPKDRSPKYITSIMLSVSPLLNVKQCGLQWVGCVCAFRLVLTKRHTFWFPCLCYES